MDRKRRGEGVQAPRNRRPNTEIAPLPLISNRPSDSPSNDEAILSKVSLVAATLPGALMFLVFLRGLVERLLDDVGDRSGVDFSGAGRKEL